MVVGERSVNWTLKNLNNCSNASHIHTVYALYTPACAPLVHDVICIVKHHHTAKHHWGWPTLRECCLPPWPHLHCLTESQMTPLPCSSLLLLKWTPNPTTIVLPVQRELHLPLWPCLHCLADDAMPSQLHASAACLHQNSSDCPCPAKCTIPLWVCSSLNQSLELDCMYTSVLI